MKGIIKLTKKINLINKFTSQLTQHDTQLHMFNQANIKLFCSLKENKEQVDSNKINPTTILTNKEFNTEKESVISQNKESIKSVNKIGNTIVNTNSSNNSSNNLSNIASDGKAKEKSEILKNEIIYSIIRDSDAINPHKKFHVTHEITGTYNKITIRAKKTTKSLFYSGERSIREKIKKRFNKVFLPKDFPHSVGHGYYQFVKYSFIYNTIYFYLNFISVQIAIESLGASLKTSIFMSAGFNWALKEAIGQIASIIGISKMGKLAEKNVKEWRALCLVILQWAFFIELSIFIFPNYFVYLAATSAFIKITCSSISMVTRTGVYLQIAKRNNLVDLILKHQNQANVAVLIGNTFGFLTTFYFNLNFASSLVIMSLGTVLAYYSLAKSNNELILNDLNAQRMYYFCKLFIAENKIPTPKEVSRCERMLFRPKKIFFCKKSPEFLMYQEKNLVINVINLFKKHNFICFPKTKFNLNKLKYQYDIYAFLRINNSNLDILKAYMCCIKLEESLNIAWQMTETEVLKHVKNSIEFTEKINSDFLVEMEKDGWKINFENAADTNSQYHIVDIDNQ